MVVRAVVFAYAVLLAVSLLLDSPPIPLAVGP